ncbi:flagellar biosynthesis protein FliA [Thermoanaerobacterium sp. PSU-2]|uniref:sigma-70 family RNA polymerase sigma factor n=1 Tax=Thermoanaerobacterium sp. PSU-2 TaxID=1930849 RepID=UPI000A15B8D2|nr:sigma-70 family RNA polymerase sigma factor [Thermoanaerobacterium sp. PSU-2]ORX23742.1 flagellar biosynthesis protein FliA [Thermoanaerobacterium sp. PSU-2]
MISYNELCFKAKSGDKDSVYEILKKFHPLLIKLAKKFPYDSFDDMLQDGREVLIAAIYQFDEKKGKEFIAYGSMQLKFYFLNAYRKKKSFLSLNAKADDDEDEIIDLMVADELTPEEKFFNDIMRNDLKEALNRLTAKQKNIIMLYFFERKTLVEISKELGVGYQSVVKLKDRALDRLRFLIKNDIIM